MCISGFPLSLCSPLPGHSNLSKLRKQLQEFTASTQQELEQERAVLLSRNAMLEQQLSELQSYIDSHMSR